jgi:hypothetical protein
MKDMKDNSGLGITTAALFIAAVFLYCHSHLLLAGIFLWFAWSGYSKLREDE